MNRFEPRRFAVSLSALVVVLACSAEVQDPTARCTQELNDKISYDCDQTIQCKIRQGMLAPSGDLQPQCVVASTQMLAAPAKRNQFLTNFGRCGRFSLCDYSNCAGTGAHGFGDMQLSAIMYNCQQTLACNVQQGAQVCEGPQALNDCVAITTGQLDALSSNDQLNYQNAHMRCGTLTGCEFVNCIRQ